MSSNVITVYGLVGASETYLAKLFDSWKRRSLTLEQKHAAGRDFEKLFKTLPKQATEPPVVFYRSYADAWTFPGDLLNAALGPKAKYKEVQFDTWAVCVGTDVVDAASTHLRGLSRKLRGRQYKELRWFIATLNDCLESIAWLGAEHLFIHVKPIGLSVDDPQILDALDDIPKWMPVRRS